MYQLYILDNWQSLAQFCAIEAEQKIICAPSSACGNTQSLQWDPLTSVSSLASPRLRAGIHGEASHGLSDHVSARNSLKCLMELILLPFLRCIYP